MSGNYWHAWHGVMDSGMRVSIIVGPTLTPDLPAGHHEERWVGFGGKDLGPLRHVATWDHEPTAADRRAAGLDDDDDVSIHG